MKKQIVILVLGLLLAFGGCSGENAQPTEPQVEQQQTEIAEENPTEQQELTVKLTKWQPKEGEIAPQEIRKESFRKHRDIIWYSQSRNVCIGLSFFL